MESSIWRPNGTSRCCSCARTTAGRSPLSVGLFSMSVWPTASAVSAPIPFCRWRRGGRGLARRAECTRAGACRQGPTFLHARCVHLEGHFLGFMLLRMTRNHSGRPGDDASLARSLLTPGAGLCGSAWRAPRSSPHCWQPARSPAEAIQRSADARAAPLLTTRRDCRPWRLSCRRCIGIVFAALQEAAA